MLLLKNATVYAPEELGKKDILICDKKIELIGENIPKLPIDMEVLELHGDVVTPGFIDIHIHFAGAGGEGSPINRTEGLSLKEIAGSGITTAVGLLGTDGYTRSLLGLLQKAYALELHGLTTYIYIGSYQVPVPTITGRIASDIIAIEKVLGVGEIAIADHRSSWPTAEELIRIASEVRVASMLSGKVGIVHLHTGSYPDTLKLIKEALAKTDIPMYHFLPTHMNRNREVLENALEYAKMGGYVDMTAVTKNITASEATKFLLENGIPIEQVTISSDGGGSLPAFDNNGNLIKMGKGLPDALMEEFLRLKEFISTEEALKPFTENPAKRLGLKEKGRIEKGKDADILIFNSSFNLKKVIAKGKVIVERR